MDNGSGFEGWKSLEKVNIIYSNEDYIDFNGKKYRKAFIAEVGTTKSCQTALKNGITWAKGGWCCCDDVPNPDIVETINEGFDFQIVSAAENSYYQGGKLSFWMCLMQKDGIEPFMVGINADLLADLILESTIYKGSVNEKVLFARKKGQLGVLHKNMPSYQSLIKDQKIKQEITQGKTTKWRPGYEYNTLTCSSIMFGYFAPIATEMGANGGSPQRYNESKYNASTEKVLILDFAAKERPYFKDTGSDWQDTFKYIIYDQAYLPEKCPSRQEGKQIFECKDDYYAELSGLVVSAMDKEYKKFPNYCWSATAFLFFRHNPDLTIALLENIRDRYMKAIYNIEHRIKDPLNEDVFDSIRYFSRECIIYHYQLRNNIEYNGKREKFHNDIIGYYNRLIEIAKIEKEKLGK